MRTVGKPAGGLRTGRTGSPRGAARAGAPTTVPKTAKAGRAQPDRSGLSPAGTSAPESAPARGRPRRKKRGQWVPPQHGAWAMLLLPYLAGLLSAGFAWPELPLLVAWIGGYLLSYFALLAVKTRRPARYRDQLLAYGLTTLAAGAVVLAARPQLILYAPVFALALAVNGFFASRRDDRALVNGLVSAAAATLILPVVVSVAGGSPWDVGGPFTVVLLYLAGTVLFVKSCIRERGNTAMFAASAAFHAAALAVAAWITPVYAVAFGWYLVRAAGLPRRRMTPLQLGLVEIVSSLLLLVSVALAA